MQTAPENIHSVNWYPEEFPEPHDIVTVRITRVDELGIWVQLLEYSCKEGMIPIGQFTTRKTRKVPMNVKVGKIDTAIISQVDKEKGNMDLTRQGLKEEDIEEAERRYNDYKSLMNLLAYTAAENNQTLQELVKNVSYPLHIANGNAYVALQASNSKPEIIDTLNVIPEVKESLRTQIQRMFTQQELRIHSTFEAEIHGIRGVEDLRKALKSGYDVAEEEKSLLISVIAPPIYSASLTTLDEDDGIEILENVLQQIQNKIEEFGGRFNIKEAPKSLTQKEAQSLRQEMDEMVAASNANEDIDETVTV
jgi:translation initiation factor 2 subunit 1